MQTEASNDALSRRRVMRRFRLDEIAAVDAPAQIGARALLLKRASAPVVPPLEANQEERARTRLHNVRARDEAEREADERAASLRPMTLRDLDLRLESLAEQARREGETMQMAYARLERGGEESFRALLTERERVASEGP